MYVVSGRAAICAHAAARRLLRISQVLRSSSVALSRKRDIMFVSACCNGTRNLIAVQRQRRVKTSRSGGFACTRRFGPRLKRLPRLVAAVEKETEKVQGSVNGSDAGADGGLQGYKSTDPRTGASRELSLGEKERLYLEAVYSFYNGEPILSNEEFNVLKEDLQWNGSQVILMNRDEQRFLNAAQAFYNGKPIMSDEDFDALKDRLRKQGSQIALQQGPRCNIETGVCYSDCQVDKLRQAIIYAPAAGIGALLWAGLSFELTPLRHVNPVWNLFIGAPVIYACAQLLTGIVLQNDPQIVVGECPSCGSEQRVFFGDILGVEGYRDVAEIKCERCKASLRLDRKRMRLEQIPRIQGPSIKQRENVAPAS
jgi:hypothetical protein